MMGWTQVSSQGCSEYWKGPASASAPFTPPSRGVFALRLCLPKMLDWEIDSEFNPPTVERVGAAVSPRMRADSSGCVCCSGSSWVVGLWS